MNNCQEILLQETGDSTKYCLFLKLVSYMEGNVSCWPWNIAGTWLAKNKVG